MIKRNKHIGMIGIFMMVITLSVVSISAIGVGFFNDLEMYPGESVDRVLSLQNIPSGNGDLKFKGTIQEGSEIFSFVGGSDHDVPDGEVVMAPVRIKIPNSAAIGESYKVRLLFKTSELNPGDSGGAVKFNSGIGASLDVRVVSKPVSPPTSAPDESGLGMGWIIVLIVVVLLVIAYLVIKKYKGDPVEGSVS